MKLLPAVGTGLNYLERVKGIEPSLFAWEAKVLPLNDTRDVEIMAVYKPSLHCASASIPPRQRERS